MRLRRMSAVALWLAVVLALLAGMLSGCSADLNADYVARNREDMTLRKPYDAEYVRDHPGAKADGLARINRVREAYQQAAERATSQPAGN